MTVASRAPMEFMPRGKFLPPQPSVQSDNNGSSTKNYGRQYASLYWYRLECLKPHLLLAAQQRWSSTHENAIYVDSLLDITVGTLCYVIGTIYMDMPLKPNVLERLEQDLEITVPPIGRSKYYGADKDVVCLEDHTGRIQLTGQPLRPTSSQLLVTGMPVAVLGKETEQGAFEVIDVCLAGIAPPSPAPPPAGDEDKFMLLLSGLELGGCDNSESTSAFQLQVLADFISGLLLGSDENNEGISAAKVVRVMIAGNSLADGALDENFNDGSNLVDPLQLLDNFVEQLATSVPVDLMPGTTDPAGYVWPQQPIHKALLPNSGRLVNLTSQTNPCAFSADGVEFLGTSGQNVSDICRYVEEGSEADNALLAASQTLKCRHMAPTAPDTLACYPFNASDPFIIDHSPHVYFIGNQDRFETALVGDDTTGARVRIVLIPSFARTGCAALLNLRTLDCFSLSLQ